MTLVDCFIPLMAFTRHFQTHPSGDAAALREKIDVLINEARRKAKEAVIPESDTQHGLFAVLAWADETLMAVQWEGAEEWRRMLLQRRYFSVSNAGVAFFSRLEALGPQQLAVREVYFFCLSMGFTGKYGHDRNPRTLVDIREACLKQLVQEGDGLYGESGKVMFPEAYMQAGHVRAGNETAKRRRGLRWSSLTVNALLVPLIVLLVLYIVYHVIIWQTANAIMAKIT